MFRGVFGLVSYRQQLTVALGRCEIYQPRCKIQAPTTVEVLDQTSTSGERFLCIRYRRSDEDFQTKRRLYVEPRVTAQNMDLLHIYIYQGARGVDVRRDDRNLRTDANDHGGPVLAVGCTSSYVSLP